MRWLARRRRRRALIRDAEALERQAYHLSRTLPELAAEVWGFPFVAAATLGALALGSKYPQALEAVKILMADRNKEKVAELRTQAKAKREEAGRLG